MRERDVRRAGTRSLLIGAVAAVVVALAPAGSAAAAPPVASPAMARPAAAESVLRLAAPAAVTPGTAVVRSDYTIPPPPKSIGRTILKSVGETLQTVGNTVATVGVTGLIANGLASAGLVTLPATVPGAAASAIIAGSGIAISVVGGFIKNYFSDPPDFAFTSIAQPARITVKTLPSRNRLIKPIDAATHRLLGAVMESYALSRAFQTSVNRADGAIIRHDTVWRDRQIAAALGYAHRGARLIGRLPGLQRAVYDAFTRAGIAASLSPANVAANRRALTSVAARAALRKELAKLGLTRYFVVIYRLIAKARPGSYGIQFPQILIDPSLAAQEHRAASELRRYRRSTVLQIIKASR